jgi:hypothetical protein
MRTPAGLLALLLAIAPSIARADGFRQWQVCGGVPFATCASVSVTVIGNQVTFNVTNLSGMNGTDPTTILEDVIVVDPHATQNNLTSGYVHGWQYSASDGSLEVGFALAAGEHAAFTFTFDGRIPTMELALGVSGYEPEGVYETACVTKGNGFLGFDTPNCFNARFTVTPEPRSIALLGTGVLLLGLVGYCRPR